MRTFLGFLFDVLSCDRSLGLRGTFLVSKLPFAQTISFLNEVSLHFGMVREATLEVTRMANFAAGLDRLERLSMKQPCWFTLLRLLDKTVPAVSQVLQGLKVVEGV